MNPRSTLLAAGILGATGVALGAFGAHALREVLAERGVVNTWETAVRYHQLHAVALLGLAVWLRQPSVGGDKLTVGWAARCWAVGTVVFSGSLYAFALGGPRWLVYATPLGGVVLLAGWACVIVAALKKED